MQSKEQILSELEALQQGACWIGYNAEEILNGIDEQLAQTRVFAGGNSIWQVVNHISYWRMVVVERLRKKSPVEPEREGFDEPNDFTAAAWRETLDRFNDCYSRLRETISALTEEGLDFTLPDGRTLRQQAAGVLLHDAFHLGQIIMLRRKAEQAT